MPGQDRFFASKIYLSVREALAGVDISATGFNVVATDLLGVEPDRRQEDNRASENSQAETHGTPHPYY
jgi:hypothetical protein